MDRDENFEGVGRAALALFQVATSNNWNDVMYPKCAPIPGVATRRHYFLHTRTALCCCCASFLPPTALHLHLRPRSLHVARVRWPRLVGEAYFVSFYLIMVR